MQLIDQVRRHSSEEEELPQALLVPLAHATTMRDPEADARPDASEDAVTEAEEAGSVAEAGGEAVSFFHLSTDLSWMRR